MQRIGWLAAAILLSTLSRDAALAAESTWMAGMAGWEESRGQEPLWMAGFASRQSAAGGGPARPLDQTARAAKRRMASEA